MSSQSGLEDTLEEERKCPYCGSEDIGRIENQVVCRECGTILEDAPVSSEQEPLYSYEDLVKEGKHSFAPESFDTRTEKRNFRLATAEINDLVDKLNLSHFIGQEAINLYKRFNDKKAVRKDVIPRTATALVYIGSRKADIPIPLKLISKKSEAELSDTVSRYQDVVEELKIEVSPPSLESLASFFAKKVARKQNLGSEVIPLAGRMVREYKDNIRHWGKDPNSIAAAAVYLSAKKVGGDVTQEEIAEVASVTGITLRDRLKEMNQLEDISQIANTVLNNQPKIQGY